MDLDDLLKISKDLGDNKICTITGAELNYLLKSHGALEELRYKNKCAEHDGVPPEKGDCKPRPMTRNQKREELLKEAYKVGIDTPEDKLTIIRPGAFVPLPYGMDLKGYGEELNKKLAAGEKIRSEPAPMPNPYTPTSMDARVPSNTLNGVANIGKTKETSDGSTASYYELPPEAKQLQDLISHKDMNAQIGEVFREIYRYGEASHCDKLRGARKMKFYIDAELSRLERLEVINESLRTSLSNLKVRFRDKEQENETTFGGISLQKLVDEEASKLSCTCEHDLEEIIQADIDCPVHGAAAAWRRKLNKLEQ